MNGIFSFIINIISFIVKGIIVFGGVGIILLLPFLLRGGWVLWIIYIVFVMGIIISLINYNALKKEENKRRK